MTNEQRIGSLVAAGYTQREASFLVTAALHNGYFVRRHFLLHIGKSSGQLDENFIRKALANGHVRAAKYRADRVLYHLGSKPLYDLIGETDNRNRRQHQVFTIKCRLMALDFVLQHQTCRFYATEREKVDLFCGYLQLDVTCLPKKRYRAPLVARVQTGSSSISSRFTYQRIARLSFTFVDEGLHSTTGFETLSCCSTSALLRELTKSRIVYIAAFPGQFPMRNVPSIASAKVVHPTASRSAGAPPDSIFPRPERLRAARARDVYASKADSV